MVYNSAMERISTAIIGGGASGLFLAARLKTSSNAPVVLFERGDRVGKKLSATGNGQGNLTNTRLSSAAYFSRSPLPQGRLDRILRLYDDRAIRDFFADLGVLTFADERGRVYPTGRQASALTDALRFTVAQRGVRVLTGTRVTDLKKNGRQFVVIADGQEYFADTVVLCTGGKAAKNFGTDGTAYALAQAFGHTVTLLTPSLVQLKTQTDTVKGLKGIRAADVTLSATWQGGAHSLRGDVIFTDYGVSGDAVFRVSAFVADRRDVRLSIDFLPDYTEEETYAAMQKKQAALPALAIEESLSGIVNNQIGRAVWRTVARGDMRAAARAVKAFPLLVTGTLGFDYAQVTKGGIPLAETDENLQSTHVDNLYFAGEILDVDGECGGYNLQWAYASACTVAAAIEEKRRG